MRLILKFAAAAAALAFAAPALAQTTAPAAPTAPSAASPAAGAASTATPGAAAATGTATNASATVAAGQPVKDSTGAVIGQVAEVKPDPSGKQLATIKMGEDTFAVDTANLAVRDGATLINATQAEIKAMMKR
jgi:hypothetical protein